MKLKIGILGGLFDPPHFGHLIVAQWVLEEFCFDKIIFVPAFNPPHKARYSPFLYRLKMIRLAIKNNKDFMVSDIEKHIKGKTYTVEVVKALKKMLHPHLNPLPLPGHQLLPVTSHMLPSRERNDDVELYLIIGADQWNEIETWRNPEELFRVCRIIVVPRPGNRINRRTCRLGKKLLISSSPLIEISSTVIRERIRRGQTVDYYIPPAVQSYIRKSRLYR